VMIMQIASGKSSVLTYVIILIKLSTNSLYVHRQNKQRANALW
jgi:hypothetical protein